MENPERGETPLIVKNGRVALPGSDELVLTDIRVQDEKIHEIGKTLPAGPPGKKVVDAGDLYVFPGGITTVIDMPCTSIPQVTDEKNLEIRLSEIRAKAVVDYMSAATRAAQREGNAPADYYRSRPETAEILAALAAAEIAEETGADLHIDDFQRLGPVLKTTPPVKSPENREKLWDLLAGGTIDFVASDHAGIPGCPTLFPSLFSEGYMNGRLTLHRFVGGEALFSKGKLTPFEGMEFRGRIKNTFLRGALVYSVEEGVVGQKGGGRLLKRDK